MVRKGGNRKGDDTKISSSLSSTSLSTATRCGLSRTTVRRNGKFKGNGVNNIDGGNRRWKRKLMQKPREFKKQKEDQDSESDSHDVEDDETKGVDHNRKDCRAQFEEEKRKVLSTIPDSVKQKFRQLGFAKWNKNYLPAMFLGPYDVAPGPVRNSYMNMLKNKQTNKTEMPYLVFWYTATEEDTRNSFSFISPKSTLMYEEGCRKGYDKIPLRIQKKIDCGKKLTDGEVVIVNALEQLNGDVKLPVEERVPWIFDFEEEYQTTSVEHQVPVIAQLEALEQNLIGEAADTSGSILVRLAKLEEVCLGEVHPNEEGFKKRLERLSLLL
eukprot:CAMPEP_0203667664 /NCGR_PEP_ID=MMETSP0090-20130426/4462_1 /ASSEMBLY_ACC=CAM_ASM_001088 /TAXON_ID=426623 /ORGANISM="Chaetoceros affinis, Strain CCMP159" /LENGTH=325 /DNA_ID=CAMNT_0050531897 /DNA_START=21 /DNA_END=998 /DNA_ORIENTATION=-